MRGLTMPGWIEWRDRPATEPLVYIYITEAVVHTSQHLLACKNTLNTETRGGRHRGGKRHETRDMSHVRETEYETWDVLRGMTTGGTKKRVEKYACMFELASRTVGTGSALNAAWQCRQVAEGGAWELKLFLPRSSCTCGLSLFFFSICFLHVPSMFLLF
jgi:hypothetical protein